MKTAICVADVGKSGYILRCGNLIVFPPNGVTVRPNWKYNVVFEENTNPKTGKKYGTALYIEHVHEFGKQGEEVKFSAIQYNDHYTIEKKKVTKLECIRCGYRVESVETAKADFVVVRIVGSNSTKSLLVPYDRQSMEESYKFFGINIEELTPNVEYRYVGKLLLPSDIKTRELDLSYKELDHDIYVYTNNIGLVKTDEIEAKCLEVRQEYDEVSIKRFINTVKGLPITEAILRSGTVHTVDEDGYPVDFRVYELKKLVRLADFIVIPKHYVNKAREYAALFKALYNILVANGFRVEIKVEGKDVKVRIEKDGKAGEAVSNAFEELSMPDNGYYGVGYYGPLAREVALLVGSQLCIKRCIEGYPPEIPYVVPEYCTDMDGGLKENEEV